MVASIFYYLATTPRHNFYAEVLGLIQHLTAFVFLHLFSEGEMKIAVQVESKRGCTVCCLQVWETQSISEYLQHSPLKNEIKSAM